MKQRIFRYNTRLVSLALWGSVFVPRALYAGLTIENPLTYNTFREVIDSVIGYLMSIVVPIGIIMILYAAFLYMTAGGNEQKVNTAHQTFLWGLIGIAIVLIGKGIVLIVCDFVGASSCL
ncbi:MAG: hypothetical protein A3I44_05490 [Candidatus Sungbacteria bacterium RIFCSPLOWO2_02_FULL_51_17]|uniref:Uncharacterized protein n=1 Tax=Candidatus Sungbacteria bacterium RIFCSPHIGHO2_02_FULL_51_29 TaxID=1802273 RepID=A0A1G2KTM3_9BACT|nr:MAG: hypothetical protein A2676_06055 [Candidatus Sungbacteria bacterium RIFCSPHIGHO2_01_FULL_51_22]OHA01962.1 MAG: hypothetical protein A3C16_02370 [Candidatus Sungbacteria bacterium RIFCSPHIGHO2_02_FULL_51_29]OHA05079.1 MAG: hypothetical protein A3B29_00355 [Candidatus Sungbacteria bacterium RIFCSPLOWO2_01_FULL_51_34]OHA11148.1 MAG: hypothetical protein A3I44_05490 [Candidatus Sungbacteria bacterium RIFCSPLOWO2_02_FULL_51_17]